MDATKQLLRTLFNRRWLRAWLAYTSSPADRDLAPGVLQVDANVQTDELRQRVTSLQRHVRHFSSEVGIDPPQQGSRGSSPERLRPQQAPLLDRMARLDAELEAATAAAAKAKACSAVFCCCAQQYPMCRCQPILQLP